MRAVLVATLGAAVVLLASACGSSQAKTFPVNVYVGGQHFASVPLGHSGSFLPKTMTVHFGVGQVVLKVDDAVANEYVDRALAKHQGRVDLPFTRFASLIKASAQKQLFHHASEITSLSMLLSAVGIDAPQVHLLPLLKRSGPLDPQPVAGSKLFRWGDPERGFVGRPNGAGSGGFGVYEPPIKRLAGKYRIHFIDLHGKSTDVIRAALLDGHPVIAWVDWTGSGAQSTWLTPSGEEITVNLGERAILLIGAGPGYYLLNDPVSGKEYKWTLSRFSERWELLGRRALELP